MRVAYLGNFGPSWSTENHVAASFELLGHLVTRIQEGDTRAVHVPDLAVGHDLFVWTQTYGLAVTGGSVDDRAAMVETIKHLGIPTVGYHLDKWFDLPREDQVAGEPFFYQDVVFTPDGGNAKRWAKYGINHHWLPPGVFEPECVAGRPQPDLAADVGFVGNWRGGYHPEWAHRAELITQLRQRYGARLALWPHGRQVRGRDLSDVYASGRVLIGDSCMVGGTGWYWSDRIPETLGREGFLLHPWTEGIDDHYTDGRHYRTWQLGEWRDLFTLVEHYLDHDDERRAIAAMGRRHVLDTATYTIRAQQVIDTVFGP
jgi:hypothetical protein